MKNVLTLLTLVLSVKAFSQSTMDSYRWYLEPNGQRVLISIDDLNDEVLTASPKMDWGRKVIPGLRLKKDVTIAVIDGGIDIEHPELKDHIAYNTLECVDGTTIPPRDGDDKDNNGYKGDCSGWDFVEKTNRPEDLDGHGTHVTGVIASVLNGVEGNFRFLPLKVFAPNEGRQGIPGADPLFSRLAKAFEYAVARKVDLIHLSVGWPKSYMTIELETIIKKAIASGITVVAAAGNSSQRATIYPCQLEGVICVGALRPTGDMARFSNWGMQVDIFAPGERILSTIPFAVTPMQISRKGYDYKNGTSQAAPFISAAMALLRGLYPAETSEHLFARLMKTADAPAKGKGLKGLFRLDKAISADPSRFVYPLVKGLNSVILNERGEFSLTIPVKNYGTLPSQKTGAGITCSEALVRMAPVLGALAPGEAGDLRLRGVMTKSSNEINCELRVGAESVSIRLKVLKELRQLIKEGQAPQDDRIVIATRSGGRSRLLTLTTLKNDTPQGFYYVSGQKDPTIYFENARLGVLKMSKGCNLLRLWQIDFNQDGVTDIMAEGLCDDKHLSYRFFTNRLEEVYSEVKYRPTLTIVNYEDFELIPQKAGPPMFRFVNVGLNVPSEDPWESSETSRSVHLYELFAVKRDDGLRFDVRVLEEPKKWQASLGLRYLPEYQVMHLMGEKLLVRMGQKTVWVDLKTQTASYAGLEKYLLRGTRKQSLRNSKEEILQGFLTPYEYRGVLLNGVVLALSQTNKFDPLIDVISTTKNDAGYLTILQSFQKLIYLQFDGAGVLTNRSESVVDRFDFLTTQDLLASVVNLETDGGSIQVVDGTKLNTSHVDVLKKGQLESYHVPSECVTQTPVNIDGEPALPVFCPVSATEFTMKFFKL